MWPAGIRVNVCLLNKGLHTSDQSADSSFSAVFNAPGSKASAGSGQSMEFSARAHPLCQLLHAVVAHPLHQSSVSTTVHHQSTTCTQHCTTACTDHACTPGGPKKLAPIQRCRTSAAWSPKCKLVVWWALLWARCQALSGRQSSHGTPCPCRRAPALEHRVHTTTQHNTTQHTTQKNKTTNNKNPDMYSTMHMSRRAEVGSWAALAWQQVTPAGERDLPWTATSQLSADHSPLRTLTCSSPAA